ncbi:MAG: hypothetical protein H6Q59_3245 [Firmicutes bacterium]|nr:hypothetical protein [Bacillota bacterium]
MDWTNITMVKKFTAIDDVFEKLGKPMFKMGSRPVYYMGKGFSVSYSPKMFKVENNNRVEYGDEGEYALSTYYFFKKQDLEEYFKIKQEQFNFESNELGGVFQIIDEIGMNSTYEQVTSYFKQRSSLAYYQEGETRAFLNGKFDFQNNFVIWGNYTFFFFGKSKETKISGFEYTFPE